MSPIMSFGKHKGRRLEDVDAGYLTWVLENVAMLNSGLRLDIKAELKRRQAQASGHYTYSASAGPKRLPVGVTLEAALALITAGRRAKAKSAHPDVTGGSGEGMAELNATADFLSSYLAEVLRR